MKDASCRHGDRRREFIAREQKTRRSILRYAVKNDQDAQAQILLVPLKWQNKSFESAPRPERRTESGAGGGAPRDDAINNQLGAATN